MSIELLIKLHAPPGGIHRGRSQRAGRSPAERRWAVRRCWPPWLMPPIACTRSVMVLRARHLGDGVACASWSAATHPVQYEAPPGCAATPSDCCGSASATTPTVAVAKRGGCGSWNCRGL